MDVELLDRYNRGALSRVRWPHFWTLLIAYSVQMGVGLFGTLFVLALLLAADPALCPAAPPRAPFYTYVVAAAASAVHCEFRCNFTQRTDENLLLWGCLFARVPKFK